MYSVLPPTMRLTKRMWTRKFVLTQTSNRLKTWNLMVWRWTPKRAKNLWTVKQKANLRKLRLSPEL